MTQWFVLQANAVSGQIVADRDYRLAYLVWRVWYMKAKRYAHCSTARSMCGQARRNTMMAYVLLCSHPMQHDATNLITNACGFHWCALCVRACACVHAVLQSIATCAQPGILGPYAKCLHLPLHTPLHE